MNFFQFVIVLDVKVLDIIVYVVYVGVGMIEIF